ncbi:sigma D regulator [Parahaliea mediterranea]|uniref:Rsd/AlgQ family anti-sigma factor n=1 Tax=Parahaliea mediterranea TaxID=651086 RepID=A0A939IK07_9GAMM|nr:Rsd/AlgQ family anti-sigma factor [Parahaliea mediterranea]MBN7798254.1 Rsd/AlgQ family anti-sigma factor [Parahaliea mediterranea]
MPNSHKDPREQYRAVESLITEWLKERRALLTTYTAMAVDVDHGPSPDSQHRRQQALCELLVDYVSAGHFEVFHQLIEEAECFADGSNALAAGLMPAIGDTTEFILAYEEKYTGSAGNGDKLSRDLSALGEILETRFELEDRLIAGLHGSHRRLMEAPVQSAS